MSRILDALRKVEAGRAGAPPPLPAHPEPRAADIRPRESRAPLPAEPARESAVPAHAARAGSVAREPAHEPVWLAPPAPELPADFRRELASLSLAVESALPGRRPRVLLVASSIEGEGTTTVAASLARSLAENPSTRVLLIDANTRRPGLSLYFGLPAGGGLAHVLNGAPASDFLHAVERGNLHVLPAAAEEGGAHQLPQPALRQFLAEVGVHYDYVVFDAPPILESPETLVLGGVVDTSLLVVRAGATKGGVVGRAMDTLAKAGVPALGVVLNRRRFDIPEAIYRRI